MGDLYSIAGFFLPESDIITFGGFFAMNSKKDFFVGRIVDEYGDSLIRGIFSKKNLIFNQDYFDGEIIKNEANYNSEKNLWEGLRSFPDGDIEEFYCCIVKNFSEVDFEGLDKKAFFLDNKLYEIMEDSDITNIGKN